MPDHRMYNKLHRVEFTVKMAVKCTYRMPMPSLHVGPRDYPTCRVHQRFDTSDSYMYRVDFTIIFDDTVVSTVCCVVCVTI